MAAAIAYGVMPYISAFLFHFMNPEKWKGRRREKMETTAEMACTTARCTRKHHEMKKESILMEWEDFFGVHK